MGIGRSRDDGKLLDSRVFWRERERERSGGGVHRILMCFVLWAVRRDDQCYVESADYFLKSGYKYFYKYLD